MAKVEIEEAVYRELLESRELLASGAHDSGDIRVSAAGLRKLLNERAALQQQVTQLQAGMTALVDASLYRVVGRFHQRFGHPVNHAPAVPDDEQVRFRLKLIKEEFMELLTASFDPGPFDDGSTSAGEHLAIISRDLDIVIESDQIRIDLPEFVDALYDLQWVNEGTALVFGVLGGPVVAEIERANMAKDPVYVAAKDAHHRETLPDGARHSVLLKHGDSPIEVPDPKAKPSKPPGWTPPDIARVLRQQGWSG